MRTSNTTVGGASKQDEERRLVRAGASHGQRIAGEALPPELAHLAEGAFAEALARAVDFAQRSVAPRTEKQYEADWAAFRAWCGGHEAPYLPAPPAVVAAYLAERSATRGRSGLRLILAAIAHHHRRAGHLWASGDPVIATVMRGILREQKRPVRPAAALTSTELRRVLARFDDDLAGIRDRALRHCQVGSLCRAMAAFRPWRMLPTRIAVSATRPR